jgi:serine/threonine-protein kinase HipA
MRRKSTAMTSEFNCFVFIYLEGALVAVPAGALTFVEESTRLVSSRFGYGKNYLERSNAVPVDPVSLPLQDAVPGTVRLATPVNGLEVFGAIRDTMPDNWGRRVIENRLKAPPNSLPESVYLQYAGSNRFGALDFRPALDDGEREGMLLPVTRLEYLLDASDRIQRGEVVPEKLTEIFDAGSTMGGMRPKAIVVRDGVQYIAKFPALNDPYNVPVIERATLELARECDLNVPQTDLVKLADGREVMLIERFDRAPLESGWRRNHVVSALTLLGLHESESRTASYADISHRMTTMAAEGSVSSDRNELFKRMVFNILVSNDDDHLRNHAFVWSTSARGWRLSPLYDVVPKPQVSTERFLHLSIGAQGRLATLDNAASHAAQFGLHTGETVEIIRHMALKVREWRTTFERVGVTVQQCDQVATAFRCPRDMGLDTVESFPARQALRPRGRQPPGS